MEREGEGDRTTRGAPTHGFFFPYLSVSPSPTHLSITICAPRITDLTQSVERFGKSCLWRLTPSTVYVIVMTEGAGGEAQVWARLEPDMIFDCEEGSHDPYTVVSPAPGDEINLEIPLESLLRAMHSTLPSRGATTPPESSMELVCSTGGGPSHMVISIQSPV